MKNIKSGIEQVKEYYLKYEDKKKKVDLSIDSYEFDCEKQEEFKKQEQFKMNNLKLKFKREKEKELRQASKRCKVDIENALQDFKGIDLSESTLSGKKEQ